MKNHLQVFGIAVVLFLIAIGSFIAYYVLFFIIFVLFVFIASKLAVFARSEYKSGVEEYEKNKQFMDELNKLEKE